MENSTKVSRKKRIDTASKPIRFTHRPAFFFVGFATIAVTAGLFSAYPKWQKQDTENWVYTYVTEHFPGKKLENTQKLAQIIYREALKLRLDLAADGSSFDRTALLLGVIQLESEFNRTAKSRVGARGFMQLMPATAALLHGRPLSTEELTDAETNITLGVTYLNEMIREMGSIKKALLAYNAGPGAVRRWGGVSSYYTRVVKGHNQFLLYRDTRNNSRMFVLTQLLGE
ncbi:MAG: hypothetical protein LDLANPLL_01602 [Turneriella sp.]|nr:hypothetical protein [Turneriella sp.]